VGFIAGGSTGLYAGLALGQIASGWIIEHTVSKRLITGDAEARSPQDAVFRGHNVFIEFTLMEYDAAGASNAFSPYAGAFGSQGTVGSLDDASNLVQILVLTAIGNTTATTAPATLTAAKAILAEGFPVRMLFAPDLREIPIRMQLFPNSGVFFVLT